MKSSTVARSSERNDDRFPEVAQAVQRSMEKHLSEPRPVFTVKVDNLFQIYLDGFAARHRQTHNCRCCRNFIEKYGRLVVISDDGRTTPLFWDPADEKIPTEYRESVRALAEVVGAAPVERVFLSAEPSWGLRRSGVSKLDGHAWEHFAVPTPRRFQHSLLTAAQAMALAEEEYGMIQRALAEFPFAIAEKACRLVEADVLYRSEKVEGPAKWFLALHEAKRRSLLPGAKHANLIWLATATAPRGFAHIKGTMIGTLLTDLKEGVSLDEAARRFKEKMHPLQYMRPQAAPSDGQLAEAEKVVAKLSAAGALERRFARFSEIECVWTPKAVESSKPGEVFGHLRSDRRKGPETVSDAIKISWAKFNRDVLPGAEQMSCYAPAHGNYFAFVTATNPEAPPIVKWDRAERRNPVSWYVYMAGSSAAQWNLHAAWVPVKGLTLSPAFWYGVQTPGEENRVCAILEGCRDTREAGNALFPEILKSEFHGIRRSIEAYAQSAKLGGREEADACGLVMVEGRGSEGYTLTLRVLSRGIWMTYTIDRWE